MSKFARTCLSVSQLIAFFTTIAIAALPASAQLTDKIETAAPAYDDHQNMMEQLGITKLRPGRNGESPNDEATANPYKETMPAVLSMKDGTKIIRADQWPKRRAEILEDFEREVYGRIPSYVPTVTWEVTGTTEGTSGGISTVTKTLVGHVDNSACPEITVNIQASFTLPSAAKQPVPILIEFGGFGGFGGRKGGPPPGGLPATQAAPPWPQQAIAHGWGYGSINPGSIQPDNNRLRTGIIGLTNKGQPRKPDDWGALRAWQWGISQLIDYFEANPEARRPEESWRGRRFAIWQGSSRGRSV